MNRNPRPRYSAAPKAPREIPEPLGLEIRSLKICDLASDDLEHEAKIADCEYMASYNLMSNPTSKILVPGKPPQWTPLPVRTRLQQDSGEYYRDENAARFPKHPFEPVLVAALHMNPSFDLAKLDTVACGSTLGNLFDFARGKAEPFSFTVQVIGTTTFLVRRDMSPTETIKGLYGYGQAFIDANTTWSKNTKGSASHQRIVTYQLGGKTTLVRFEADAYMMEQGDDLDDDPPRQDHSQNSTALEDDLANKFSLGTGARREAPQGADSSISSEVRMIEGGSEIAQSSIIDIKTRASHKVREDVMAEQMPRWWLRQIDNLVLSFHEKGLFKPPDVEDIRAEMSKWEAENEAAIARLVCLIEEISNAASGCEGKKVEVRCKDSGSLELHTISHQGEWNAVSDEMRARWET